MARRKLPAEYNPKAVCECCGKHPFAEGRFVLSFLFDASGSMGGLIQPIRVAFNNFVAEQQKLPTKVEAVLNLASFSDTYTQIFRDVAMSKVPKLGREYETSGSTELFAAIKTAIDRLEQDCSHNDRILQVIICDGDDNGTKRGLGKIVRNMMAERMNRGNWEFVFITPCRDANDNAAAQTLGLSASATCAQDYAGINRAFKMLGESISQMRTNRKRASSFTWA